MRPVLVTVTAQPMVTTLLVVSTGTTLFERLLRSIRNALPMTAIAALVVTSWLFTTTLTPLVEARCPAPPARSE